MTALPCPPWCVQHKGYDRGTRDEVLAHLGTCVSTADYVDIHLRRDDMLAAGEPGKVHVWLGGEPIELHDADELGQVLRTLAAAGQLVSGAAE